ncbi:MAG: MFS transporter [Solirubrobacteraceae bacterium]
MRRSPHEQAAMRRNPPRQGSAEHAPTAHGAVARVDPVDDLDELSAADTSGAPANRWLVLIVVCFAQFMVVLDATIVNVALPSIHHGLKFSESNLQWIVNAYTLAFGGFLLLGGRASDLIGRKRLFLAGLVVFSSASLLDGLATSSGMLIAFRALQGLGAALVSPAALSIVTTSFPDSRERAKALGAWSAIAVSGSAFGLLLGGVLTTAISWRWIFFVNVPVGALTLLATLRIVPESVVQLRSRAFDLAGAISVTAGLSLIVYTVVGAQSHGWGSAWTIGLGALGIGLLVTFLAIEARAEFPLMRLGIFKLRSLAVANATLLLVGAGMFSMFFFASLYIQEIKGYDALEAGVAFLPLTGGIILGAGLSQLLMRRLGLRGTATLGLILATGGMAWLIRLPVHGSYGADLLSGLMPLSLGLGLVFVPLTLLATSGVEGEDAGLASGLFNTAQQVGGALGLAILSTLAADRTSSVLGGAAGSVALSQRAEVDGFHVAFIGGTALMAVAGLAVVLFLRERHVAHVDVSAPVPVGA